MSSFQIDIKDFSNGQIDSTNAQEPKWEGTGIFDVIIKAANENIKIQHKTSRITGAEYAEVYLGTMQSAISEAMKFLLIKEITEKDIALKEVEIANNVISGENLIKQGELIEEQIKTSKIDRVMKDKQTAMLGMDGVMKKQNLITDKEVVYTPKYNIQQG